MFTSKFISSNARLVVIVVSSGLQCIQLSGIKFEILGLKFEISNLRQQFSGGCIGRVTPVPIPNTAVKPTGADDTASFRCGKVGSRRIYINKKPAHFERAFSKLIRRLLTFPQLKAAVSSAQAGLTTVFGMGTGVTLPIQSPEN